MKRGPNFYGAIAQTLRRRVKQAEAHEELRLGDRIREFRERAGLTGAELCRRAGGVDPRTLTAIEKGRIRNPSLRNLQRISRGLGCLVRDLFTAAEMAEARNYHRGSQKGVFQIEFPKLGLKIISATPPLAEFFCGKLILESQRRISGNLLKNTSPLFLEVVMGQIEFEIEGEKMTLKEGENLFLNGGLRHSFRNPLNRDSALWLVTAPSFFPHQVPSGRADKL